MHAPAAPRHHQAQAADQRGGGWARNGGGRGPPSNSTGTTKRIARDRPTGGGPQRHVRLATRHGPRQQRPRRASLLLAHHARAVWLSVSGFPCVRATSMRRRRSEQVVCAHRQTNSPTEPLLESNRDQQTVPLRLRSNDDQSSSVRCRSGYSTYKQFVSTFVGPTHSTPIHSARTTCGEKRSLLDPPAICAYLPDLVTILHLPRVPPTARRPWRHASTRPSVPVRSRLRQS